MSQQLGNENKSDGLLLVEGIKKTLKEARERFLRYQQLKVFDSPIPSGQNWRDVRFQKYGF